MHRHLSIFGRTTANLSLKGAWHGSGTPGFGSGADQVPMIRCDVLFYTTTYYTAKCHHILEYNIIY